MNVKELLKQAYLDVKLNRHLRIGQAIFNRAHSVNPRFADEFRGTDIDPFHASDYEDERVQGFLKAIGGVE